MAIRGCRWRVVCRRRSRRWKWRSHRSGRLRNAEAGAEDAAAARVALPWLYRREALGVWATHRRRALQRNRQTRARIHWERSGEFAQVFCTTRLALSLPGLKLGKERKPYAAVRHLMKRASRPRGRGPRVALTATGSWWPRLRRRGGACLMRSCDKERAARASLGLRTGRRNSIGCPEGGGIRRRTLV